MQRTTTRLFIQALFAILFIPSIQLKAQLLLDPLRQPKFVNPLPIPSVIDGRSGGTLDMSVTQFTQWLGLVDPVTNARLQTKVWGYNGSYPGPTILATKDVPLNIYWRNRLVDGAGRPLPHFLPVDKTLHWAFSDDKTLSIENDGVPIVTHLHGGHTEAASDGLPDAWVTPTGQKGMGFEKGGDVSPYLYSNDQEAATIWYHDHALGITRLNVYAGLAGFYLVTDNNEKNLKANNNLPADPYDIGLAIQDRMFTADGQLHYPSTLPGGPTPSVLPEFFGDFILVNGVTWPVLDVEPRQYRFRMLNGSDSRFYNLRLSNDQPFTEIGSDNGLLPSPVLAQSVLIAPGERKDVIIDFSGSSGQLIIVRNNAKAPYPMGAVVNSRTTGQIMAFRVSKPLNADYPLTTLPAVLRPPITRLTTNLPARQLILFEALDSYGRLKPSLGTVADGALAYMDPVTETPKLNTTEIWEIYNETMDAHPIHLHAVTMQILNRQKFTATVDPVNGKPANIQLKGQPMPPAADETGWKDTWVMYPGEVTRVIAKFDLKGMYVWHCHILSHEDNEMMRPFQVVDDAAPMTRNAISPQMMEQQIGLKVSPNPFSSTVSVRFSMGKSAMVSVELLDQRGARIKSVFQGMRPAGPQQFDIDGSHLPNGTYFSVITVDGTRMVRKLVLQK